MTLHIGQVTITVTSGADAVLTAQILAKLDILEQKVDTIIMKEQDALNALKLIDDTTTAIGVNVAGIKTITDAIGPVATSIDTGVKAIIEQLKGADIPQSVMDALAALGAKAIAISDASADASTHAAAQITVLNGIAAEVTNVVPVAPPPPPLPPSFAVAQA